MSLGTRLFVLICPALLPTDDPDEPDYHTTLGLGNKKNASLDEIRRAYRAKSLDLHPDRLAYRRETNNKSHTEQAAEEYKRVQEAYAVLSDPQQRQKYAAVGYSPARFRFFSQGGGAASHPVALLENLAKASCADKTKLVLLVSVLLCLVLLQPILIASKVNAVIEGEPKKLQDTKWVVLLIPFWILHGLVIIFWTMLVVLVQDARTKLIMTWLEQVAWFVGCFCLAVAWDKDDRQDVQWHLHAIPFYVAMICKSVGARLAQSHLRQEQDKMASPEFVQATEDTHLNEMTEEQLLELNKKYVIITVDPHHIAAEMAMRTALNDSNNNNNNNNTPGLSDEEMEEIKVTTSPEYLEHEHMIRQRQSDVVEPIVFGITFIALVAARVEDQIDVSWWLIFLPLLVPLGFRFLSVCCMSLCLPLMQFSEELEEMAAAAEHAAEEEEAAALQQQQQQQQQQQPAEDEALGDQDNVSDVETGGVAQNDVQQAESEKQGESQAQSQSSNRNDGADSKTEDSARVKPVVAPTKETAEPKQDEGSPFPSDEEAVSESTEAEKVDKQEDEGEPEIEFNEETFHEWYSAHRQAEQSAMEARAKAQSACCWFCFQLVILCLIIGKLDQDYDNTDDDAGYNAFWILFPVFAVMGMVLCCCSCLIYGAGASTLEGLAEQNKQHDDANPTEGAASAGESNANPIIAPQLAQTTDHMSTSSAIKPTGGTAPENSLHSSTDQPVGESSKAAASIEGSEVKKTEEIVGDMDDLD